ncbi:MAG: DUF4398 domain-containing protein [Gammaproteobacteria bacterium]
MKISNRYDAHRIMTHVSLGGIAGVVLLVTGCASMPPPTEQMAVAKASVTRAASVGGNEYAPIELRSATEKMTAAEQAMADENYVKAQRLAEQAQVDAKLAETKAALAKAEVAVRNAEESNRILRQEMDRATP